MTDIGRTPPADRVSPRGLDRYLRGALREIRRTALFSADVDWEAVYRKATRVLADAGGYADTHPFLAEVLAEAGGRHSRLVPAAGRARAAAASGRAATASGAVAVLPHGGLHDGIGSLVLPRAAGGRTYGRRYIDAGADLVGTLAASRPRGWIVDLRLNGGGGMWPMLAAVAGLLDPGDLGYFALPGEGAMQPWSLGRRWVTAGRRPMNRHHGARLRAPGVPIGVLISHQTASAGEAAVIALRGQSPSRTFGTPTAGLTTANRTHLLRDGTRLWISGRYYADPDRRLVTGPIVPDEAVADEAAGVEAQGSRPFQATTTGPHPPRPAGGSTASAEPARVGPGSRARSSTAARAGRRRRTGALDTGRWRRRSPPPSRTTRRCVRPSRRGAGR